MANKVNLENKDELLNLLKNNGVNENYLKNMEGIESGSDEWINILIEYIDKDPINDTLTDEDNKNIDDLIYALEDIGIYLV